MHNLQALLFLNRFARGEKKAEKKKRTYTASDDYKYSALLNVVMALKLKIKFFFYLMEHSIKIDFSRCKIIRCFYAAKKKNDLKS